MAQRINFSYCIIKNAGKKSNIVCYSCSSTRWLQTGVLQMCIRDRLFGATTKVNHNLHLLLKFPHKHKCNDLSMNCLTNLLNESNVIMNHVTYPIIGELISLHHHLEFFIYLVVLCFSARSQLVLRIAFRTIRTTCTIFMFLFI